MSYIAATGAVGAGVDAESLFAALAHDPQFIAADAGTTDAGAFALGTGVRSRHDGNCKRSLHLRSR